MHMESSVRLCGSSKGPAPGHQGKYRMGHGRAPVTVFTGSSMTTRWRGNGGGKRI